MRQSRSLNWELSAEKPGLCEVKAIGSLVTATITLWDCGRVADHADEIVSMDRRRAPKVGLPPGRRRYRRAISSAALRC